MNSTTKIAAAFLVLVTWPVLLNAQPSTSGFETANKLYYENQFTNAAGAYEGVIRSGQVSAAIYFNLGNAWLKAGQLGRAIAAYRQAQLLSPRDPDIRANLQFARNQTQGPTLAATRWERWLSRLTLNEWTFLSAGAVWLWFFVMTILQWKPGWFRPVRGWLALLTLAAVLSCVCLATAMHIRRSTQIAIVTRETPVQQGPVADSRMAFPVHDGAELRVLERKDEWLLVSTDPRRVGWLRRDQVLLESP